MTYVHTHTYTSLAQKKRLQLQALFCQHRALPLQRKTWTGQTRGTINTEADKLGGGNTLELINKDAHIYTRV